MFIKQSTAAYFFLKILGLQREPQKLEEYVLQSLLKKNPHNQKNLNLFSTILCKNYPR